MRDTRGLTYLELLLVIALVLLVGSMSSSLYSNFILQNASANATNQIKSDLREAQLFAMEGKQNSNWGINVGNSAITLYKGNSYATRNPAFDQLFSLNSNITATISSGVTFDASSSTTNTSNVSTLTWTHTTTMNAGRILIVGVSEIWDNPVSSVTYAGVSLSKVNMSTCASSACKTEMWYMINPPSGSNSVVVNFSSSQTNLSAGATSYYGVNTANPLGTSVVNSGALGQPSITVTSTSQQVIADTLAINTSQIWTPGSGQTQAYQTNPSSNTAAASYEQGLAGSTPMSWSAASGANWADAAVPINPAPAFPTLDATSSAFSAPSVSSLTWSHTTSSATNRILVVGVSETWNQSVSGITYAGAPLTFVNTATCGSSACKTEMWYLPNPAVGTNNIIITFSRSQTNDSAGAATYYNVDPVTPVGTAVATPGLFGTAITTTIASTLKQLIVDATAINTNQTWNPGSGQSLLYQINPTANSNMATGSYQSGLANSTPMSWSGGSSVNWAQVVMPLNAATSFEVNFSRLTGTPSASGIITISGAGSSTKTIMINSQGIATQ